jgi:uncharacterized repeat protein (TIGR03803 family)
MIWIHLQLHFFGLRAESFVSRAPKLAQLFLTMCTVACLFATEGLSQNHLWGTLPQGGKGVGLIYNFKTDGSDFKIAKTFELDLQEPLGYILDGDNGYFYGVSQSSGAFSKGALYKVSTDGTIFSIIHDFDGEQPSGLILLNGVIYGTTNSGGTLKYGSIYTINLDGSNFKVIYEFNGVSGATPNGGLLKGSDNNLYGTASGGGSSGTGTVFKIDGSNNAFTKLYEFQTFGGAYPNGFLVEGADGNLYGTTSSGFGSPTAGSAFSLSKTGSSFKNLKSFAAYADGQNIYGSVAESSAGKLFGTFNHGGAYGKGGLYRMDKDGLNYNVVHSFQGADGEYPSGSLILWQGDFYGSTSSGGTNGYGVIYKISDDGTTFTKVLDLDKKGGYGVSLILSDSELYFSSFHGGLSGFGAIGSLDLANKTVNIIKDFNPVDGGAPTGKLLYHSNGYVYGTTSKGGKYGSGVLFKIDPLSEIYDVIYNFKQDTLCCSGSIMESYDGNILGIVNFSNGTQLFKYDVQIGSLAKVFDVADQKISSIWEGIDGELFGNKSNMSGKENMLFQTDSIRSKIYDIDNTTGSIASWLIVPADTATFMLGITSGNPGSNFGQIVSYNFIERSIDPYYNFTNSTYGSRPTGELAPLKSGEIFGVTSYGGVSGGGTIFDIDASTKSLVKIFDFPAESYPIDIERVSDSLFYGVLFENGSDPNATNCGAIYQYKMPSGFSLVKNFKDINNYYATSGLTRVVKDEAILRVYGDQLAFGSVEVNDTIVKYLHIRNFGHTTLSVDSINLPAGFYASENSFTLDPGHTKLVKVYFAPQDTIAYSGILEIISTAETSSFKMPVSGLGYVVIENTDDPVENLINVYPNPVRSQVYIKSPSTIESVKVVNLLGTSIAQETHINKTEHTINLNHYPKGVYLLLITDIRGNVSRKKIFFEGSLN